MKNKLKHIIPLILFLLIFFVIIFSWQSYSHKKMEKSVIQGTGDRLFAIAEYQAQTNNYLLKNHFTKEEWLYFIEESDKLEIGKYGYLWILDNNGIVRYHPNTKYIGGNILVQRKNVVGQIPDIEFKDIIRKMIQGEKGVGTYSSSRWWAKKNRNILVKKIMAYHPIDVHGEIWSIGISVKYNDVSAPVLTNSKMDFLGMSVIFLISCFIGFFIYKKQIKIDRTNLMAEFPEENSNPVLRVSSKGEILYANKASCVLLKAWGITFGDHIPSIFRSTIDEVLILKKDIIEEAKNNGSIFSLTFTYVNDKYVNIYGMDITFAKRAEEEIQNNAIELQKINREVEEFAYIASHDLQEPARTVAAYCQLLKMGCYDNLQVEEKKYLDYAISSSNRMKTLIKELLDYSRVGDRHIPFDKIDLGRLMEEILDDFEIKIKETKASLIIEQELPEINGVNLRIKQLFHNLISNSLKFINVDKPVIKIGYYEEGNYWHFYIQDNGIGIEPEYHEMVFGIFKRLYSREEYPGTGIGLAICKRIIESHCGKIWVDPTVTEGTKICFTIFKSLGETI
jgi:signal transduction histidine kinase